MRRETSKLQLMLEHSVRRRDSANIHLVTEENIRIYINNKKIKNAQMDQEQSFEMQRPSKKIRVKVVTNRGIQFITSVKQEATVSDLANRALSVYLELSGQLFPNTSKKQLTVSAVKQGVFYMPKSEYVANLLSNDEQVEVVIIKAKPKYPHQLFQEEYVNKKNRPVSPQASAPESHSVSPQPSLQTVQIRQEPKMKQNTFNTSIRLTQRPLEESKRQKKREKRKDKQKKKHHVEPGHKESIVYENSRKEEMKLDIVEEDEEIPQSVPRKKIKQDKEDINRSQQKAVTKVMPSPKITFHQAPMIDSPRINLLPQIPKRKPTIDLQTPKLQGKIRLQSEDTDKPKVPESQGTQLKGIKSPSVVGHKTPQNMISEHDLSRARERQELSNFSLSHRGSDDKKIEAKGKKNGEKEASGKQNGQINKELLQSSIVVILQKNSQGVKNKSNLKNTSQFIEQSLPVVEAKVVPVKKSLVIVQPPSGSDSEENKNVIFTNHSSTRSKQLDQLKSRIRSFIIDSEDEV